MQAHQPIERRVFTAGRMVSGFRNLPTEVPIAISYNGTTQAVMMATPTDLRDFALGFSLTEGIALPEEITDITVVEVPGGYDLQIWLVKDAEHRLTARRRTMIGPVGCGLCGIDSIEQAIRAPRLIISDLRLTPQQVMQTMSLLPAFQTLHNATRAAHAAAFFVPERGIVTLREDVGRHNALDKLAGSIQGTDCATGAVVLTSRVSVDMVQKCCAMGVPVLIAASAPTAHAIQLAEQSNLTVVGLARLDSFEIFTHHRRIQESLAEHVA
jgi:FdhD protein